MTSHNTTALAGPPVVIVSACSAGALVARVFAEHAPCVHVFPGQGLTAGLRASIPEDVFVASHDVDALGFEETLRLLRSHAPRAVVAASEWGVELADTLAAALGLVGNQTTSSRARRDKYEMARVAKAAGIPVAEQHSGRSADELTQWYVSRGGGWAVVKPRDSAGSDNVYVCCKEEEVRASLEAVLSACNLMQSRNDRALIQEYLDGQEFVVNTVSLASRHWVTDVWAVKKRLVGGRNIYDYDDLVHVDTYPEVIAYALGVLDAVGLENGPGHSEVILTPSGPKLLETGARVSGAASPEAIGLATGADQTQLAVECYLYPDVLFARPIRYVRHKHARSVHLISGGGRCFAPDRITQFLETLPSFCNIRYRASAGQILPQTVDVVSCPGAFFLVHADGCQVRRDYEAYREWEKENL